MMWKLLVITYLSFGLIVQSFAQPQDDLNSGSAEDSMEEDNPNDRGLGFKKKGTPKPNKYPFYPTPEPGWTESPHMLQKEKDLGRNDIDDVDKDYFATYDFEFAKSGSNHPNFQTKYLKYQEHIINLGKAGQLVGKGPLAPEEPDTSFLHKTATEPSDILGAVRGLLQNRR